MYTVFCCILKHSNSSYVLIQLCFYFCTDPGVWNLGVWPLELVSNEPKLLCVVQIFPNTFMHVVKLGFEGNILSLLCGDGTCYCTSSGSKSKSCMCILILQFLNEPFNLMFNFCPVLPPYFCIMLTPLLEFLLFILFFMYYYFLLLPCGESIL